MECLSRIFSAHGRYLEISASCKYIYGELTACDLIHGIGCEQLYDVIWDTFWVPPRAYNQKINLDGVWTIGNKKGHRNRSKLTFSNNKEERRKQKMQHHEKGHVLWCHSSRDFGCSQRCLKECWSGWKKLWLVYCFHILGVNLIGNVFHIFPF